MVRDRCLFFVCFRGDYNAVRIDASNYVVLALECKLGVLPAIIKRFVGGRIFQFGFVTVGPRVRFVAAHTHELLGVHVGHLENQFGWFICRAFDFAQDKGLAWIWVVERSEDLHLGSSAWSGMCLVDL